METSFATRWRWGSTKLQYSPRGLSVGCPVAGGARPTSHSLRNADYPPFEGGIKAGLGSVMCSVIPPPPLPRAARAAGSLPRQMCCDCCLAVILLGSRCCGRLCGQLMCGCVGGGGIPLPGWSLRAPRAPAPHTSPLRFSRFPPELFLPRLRLSDPCSGVQLYLSMASPPPPPTATIATSTTGCVRTVGPVRSGTGAAATTARCSATSRYF